MRGFTVALFLLLLEVGCSGGFPEERARRAALDEAVDAISDSLWSGALGRHGPIRPDEVPYLIDQTGSFYERRRHNATKLLIRARLPQATAHLRRLAQTTKDEKIWLLVMAALLREPDAPALAAARPQLLDKALESDDDADLTVALSAAILAERPFIYDQIERMLDDPNKLKRYGALHALARVGPGPLAPKLVESALAEARTQKRVDGSLLTPLLYSNDPRLAPIFHDELLAAHSVDLLAWRPDLRDPRRRQPWLRALLLKWAQQPGERWVDGLRGRWARQEGLVGDASEASREAGMKIEAMALLVAWGPELERELLQSCAEAYEAIPKGDAEERKKLLEALSPCRSWLGTLAGRKTYETDDAEVKAALAFARQRLAGPQR